eukprot:CAMPEP_0182887662 /NCGR_PEP_ID=MMETSP0034_2-20130328/20960_1 /TAXON_ID=156128 /ORGANISM="Nephroselmis pyriformis, Strain CCMP717" /LENGTH=1250 /DNA_ID=CAMNT_0025021039 /DNA_START=158 /DNA_END=3907 /DNA_ORIENTATION=+
MSPGRGFHPRGAQRRCGGVLFLLLLALCLPSSRGQPGEDGEEPPPISPFMPFLPGQMSIPLGGSDVAIPDACPELYQVLDTNKASLPCIRLALGGFDQLEACCDDAMALLEAECVCSNQCMHVSDASKLTGNMAFNGNASESCWHFLQLLASAGACSSVDKPLALPDCAPEAVKEVVVESFSLAQAGNLTGGAVGWSKQCESDHLDHEATCYLTFLSVFELEPCCSATAKLYKDGCICSEECQLNGMCKLSHSQDMMKPLVDACSLLGLEIISTSCSSADDENSLASVPPPEICLVVEMTDDKEPLAAAASGMLAFHQAERGGCAALPGCAAALEAMPRGPPPQFRTHIETWAAQGLQTTDYHDGLHAVNAAIRCMEAGASVIVMGTGRSYDAPALVVEAGGGLLVSGVYSAERTDISRNFIRTIPAMDAISLAVVALVNKFGWRQVAFLRQTGSVQYLDVASLEGHFADAGVAVESFEFSGVDAAALEAAVLDLKASGARVIIPICPLESSASVVFAARRKGMMALDGYSWIWMHEISLESIGGRVAVAELYEGHLYIAPAPASGPVAESAREALRNLGPGGLRSLLPPEAQEEAKGLLTQEIVDGTFDTAVAGYVYDMVGAAIGGAILARQAAGPGSGAEFGSDIFRATQNLSFNGATGPVSFTPAGDRDRCTSSLHLFNVQRLSSAEEGRSHEAARVGAFRCEGAHPPDGDGLETAEQEHFHKVASWRLGEHIIWPDGTSYPDVTPGDGYVGASAGNILPVVLVGCAVGLVVCALFATLGVFLRRQVSEAYDRWLIRVYKSRGAPSEGQEVTIVITDMQGSTTLWDCYPQAMSRALLIHHHLLRGSLKRFFGHELTTEGDSFRVAFHTALDAAAWCCYVQEELMSLDWPQELLDGGRGVLQHKPDWARPDSATARGRRGLITDALGAQQKELLERAIDSLGPEAGADVESAGYELVFAEGGVRSPSSSGRSRRLSSPRFVRGPLFRGPRIRMGIHTGIVPPGKLHEGGNMEGKVAYGGQLMRVAKKVSDIPCGGQIVMSGAALASINVEDLREYLRYRAGGGAEVLSDPLIIHLGKHAVHNNSSRSMGNTLRQGLVAGTPAEVGGAGAGDGAGGGGPPRPPSGYEDTVTAPAVTAVTDTRADVTDTRDAARTSLSFAVSEGNVPVVAPHGTRGATAEDGGNRSIETNVNQWLDQVEGSTRAPSTRLISSSGDADVGREELSFRHMPQPTSIASRDYSLVAPATLDED